VNDGPIYLDDLAPGLLAENERLRTLLRDLAIAPVITEARGYVEVQIDRPTWEELAEWRPPPPPPSPAEVIAAASTGAPPLA